jgi:hypothetical protein
MFSHFSLVITDMLISYYLVNVLFITFIIKKENLFIFIGKSYHLKFCMKILLTLCVVFTKFRDRFKGKQICFCFCVDLFLDFFFSYQIDYF